MENSDRKVFADGIKLIDLMREDGRSAMYGETLAKVRLRYPNAKIMSLDAFIEKKERELSSAPVEITPERYEEMLCVLPPDQWVRKDNGDQSFELCEHTSGRVTACFVRIGQKYFEFQGIAGTSHKDKIAKCRGVM